MKEFKEFLTNRIQKEIKNDFHILMESEFDDLFNSAIENM